MGVSKVTGLIAHTVGASSLASKDTEESTRRGLVSGRRNGCLPRDVHTFCARFQVTKKGIEHQMNCALEQISTRPSACSCSARNLPHLGETDHAECFDYRSKSRTRVGICASIRYGRMGRDCDSAQSEKQRGIAGASKK